MIVLVFGEWFKGTVSLIQSDLCLIMDELDVINVYNFES